MKTCLGDKDCESSCYNKTFPVSGIQYIDRETHLKENPTRKPNNNEIDSDGYKMNHVKIDVIIPKHDQNLNQYTDQCFEFTAKFFNQKSLFALILFPSNQASYTYLLIQ